MTSETEHIPRYDLPSGELHFLASETGLYDYSNLYAFASWFSGRIEIQNLESHRPLLLLAESSDVQIFTIAACWLLRIPFLPVAPTITGQELNSLLSSFVDGPKLVITDKESAHTLDMQQLKIGRDKLTMSRPADSDAFSSGHPEESAGYLTTSGSTGRPKIVPIKRRQVLYAAQASENNFRPEPNFFWLLCLPLNHIGGISVILRSILYHSAIYRMDRFDTALATKYLAENKMIQVASMVPTMLRRLLENRKFRVHKTFRALLLGGGPIPLTLIQKSEIRGVPVVSSYGMTETCGQIAANPILFPSGAYIPKMSLGRVFPPNDIEIRNEKGDPVRRTEKGDIWLKGPQVFDGYHADWQNREVFDDAGWFRTGDYGHLNRLGHLFVESRRSDRIITGGENVDPVEVERELERLPSIQQAVVVGVDDNEWGEIVVSFIIASDDELPDSDALREVLKKKLSRHKIPKTFIVVEEFPLTDSGKINRKELRTIYYNESSSG